MLGYTIESGFVLVALLSLWLETSVCSSNDTADAQISVPTALGCNWIFDSRIFGWSYAENECVYDSRLNTITGEPQTQSSKYVCNEDNLMIEYNYDNADCSGTASDTSSVSDEYECASNQDSCDYVTLVEFDAGSNCSVDGTDFNEYKSYVIDDCVNNSYYSTSQSEYDYQSVYVTCDINSFRVRSYEDSDDCSGDATFDITYSAGYYADEDNDYQMYCSTAGEWSGCNESNGNNRFIMNIIYVSAATAMACLGMMHVL